MPIFQPAGGTPYQPSFFEQLLQLGVPQTVMAALERADRLKLRQEEIKRETKRDEDQLLLTSLAAANDLSAKITDPEQRSRAIGTYAAALASGIGGDRGAKIAEQVAALGGPTAQDEVNKKLIGLGLRKAEAETTAAESAASVAKRTESERVTAARLGNEATQAGIDATRAGTALTGAQQAATELETGQKRDLAPLMKANLEAEIRVKDAQAAALRSDAALKDLAAAQAKDPGSGPPSEQAVSAALKVRDNANYTINSMLQALVRSGKTEADNDSLAQIFNRLNPTSGDPSAIDRTLGEAKQYVSPQTYAEIEAAVTKAKLDLAQADAVVGRALGQNMSVLTPGSPGVAIQTQAGVSGANTTGQGLNPSGKAYQPPQQAAPQQGATGQPQGQPGAAPPPAFDASAVGGTQTPDGSVSIPAEGYGPPPPDGRLEPGKIYYANGLARYLAADGTVHRVAAKRDPVTGALSWDPNKAIVTPR